MGETRVVDEVSERFGADFAATDRGMAIDAAPEFAQAVVEMPNADPSQADGPVQRLDGFIVLRTGFQGIARREDVTRIDAHRQALRATRAVDDSAQVFEAVAQARPLTRGRFQGDPGGDPGSPPMDFVDRLDDPVQALFLPRSHMRSRMRHDRDDSESLGPFQFDDHRGDRFFPKFFVRTGEIDEVRIMRDRIDESRFFQRRAKRGDLVVLKDFGVPLIIIFREQLERVKADRFGGESGSIVTAGHRHVSAEFRWHRVMRLSRSATILRIECHPARFRRKSSRRLADTGCMPLQSKKPLTPFEASGKVEEKTMGWVVWAGLLPVCAVAAAIVLLRLARRVLGETRVESARDQFRRQREWLEARFLTALAKLDPEERLRWEDAHWHDEVLYARDRQTRRLLALIGVHFDPDPLDLDAGPYPRHATALFEFRKGQWNADGKRLDHVRPDEAFLRNQRFVQIVLPERRV